MSWYGNLGEGLTVLFVITGLGFSIWSYNSIRRKSFGDYLKRKGHKFGLDMEDDNGD